jgi:hypothetical protein
MRYQHRSGLELTVKDLEMIAAAKMEQAEALPEGPERLELLELASALYERAEMKTASCSERRRLN